MALLSSAIWLSVQFAVLPDAEDVQCSFPSGPEPTVRLFLTLLRLVLTALDCCPVTVRAARSKNAKAIATAFTCGRTSAALRCLFQPRFLATVSFLHNRGRI
jgi:hypothetical protein